MSPPKPRRRLGDPPAEPVQAVLSLGANLGDRLATLQSALDDLAGYEGIRVTAASPVVETAPVGGPEQPDYLNAVVLVYTALAPLELLAACQQVEHDHGRERHVRWGSRTLDIDVITYDDVVAASTELELPHPRAAERAFVLAPWLAVQPTAVLRVGGDPVPVGDLLARAPDRDGVRATSRPDLRVPR
jgi:dihydroneopterin aldolase/2-amino-4-hydroxy-6-hydroxymethyldihydropteridine diphosphokinase